MGGVDGRTEATGRGLFYALNSFFNSTDIKKTKIKGNLSSQKIILEGLGKVGYFAAKALRDHGCNIIGIIENNVAPISKRITDTATIAEALLLIFRESLYTTGSASADKTTATNRSKINDLTLKNIKTEIEINKTYKKALFKSSCRVSPFGRFTII